MLIAVIFFFGKSVNMEKLTRGEKFSFIGPVVAILAAVAAWGSLFVVAANRRDAVGKGAREELNAQIDDRIDKKLASVANELHNKTDAASVMHQIEALRAEQNNTLQSIHSGLEKNNILINGTKEDLAKLTGRTDSLEKDLNLLLQRQLRSSADLPNTAIGSQLPNIALLYQLASRRKALIPTEVDRLIREKIASIGPTGPAYWLVAGTTISRESAALIGDSLKRKRDDRESQHRPQQFLRTEGDS